jgi:uncharacterized membrane protein
MVMDAQIIEWLSLLFRWAHVVVALAWIGASFYLISWENKFNRTKDLKEGVEGDFWTIQGGDFYFIEKLKGAPTKVPEALHWFKYEAYLTWVSGFMLMCLIYYVNASVMLLDRASPLRTPYQAVAASMLSLTAVWLIYAFFSRTRAAKNLRLSAVIGILAVAGMALFYNYLFNSRAALIHLGAAMGTIMSANVFFVIIPWHRKYLDAIRTMQPLDAIHDSHPGFRSRHNHYLTLPVIFLMLMSHSPMMYSADQLWLVATLIVATGGFFKHFHTCIQKKHPSILHLVIGITLFAAAILMSQASPQRELSCAQTIPFSEVRNIVSNRCNACHDGQESVETAPGFPSRISLETPDQLWQLQERISTRVVIEKTMPPTNATGMPDSEREILGCWLQQVAREN